MTEIWKAIPGYEGAYEVSNLGRVRSLDHDVRLLTRWGGYATRRVKGRVLSEGTENSYPSVNLWVGGKVTHRRIHVLVAAAFLGPRPAGLEVCHKDGRQQNCHADNLRYGTPTSNNADKVQHDTLLMGERCPWAKLTESEVREIRALRGRQTRDVIADRYGISGPTVSNIQLRKTWRHV